MATSDEFSKTQKGLALAIGFIECLLFGGVIYGWADLVYVMKSENIFYDKCTNDTSSWFRNNGSSDMPSCKDQDNMYNDAFTIASFGRGMGALFVALLLDYAGLRITRLVAIFSIITGGVFTALCSKGNPYFLFPGALLISLGGAEIRLADFKIANMFPRHKATVMSVYNGAFCGSSAVFLALKQYVCDDNNNRATFLYVWSGISAAMLFPTFLLLPKSNIVAIDEAEKVQQSAEKDDEENQPLIPSNVSVNTHQNSADASSIFRSLRTFSYWLHVYTAGNITVGLTLYIASFNLWVDNVSHDREEVSSLSEAYGYCQLPMILVAPLIGILMDTAVKKALAETEESIKRKKLQQAGFLSLMCASIIMTLLLVCKIFQSVLSIKLSLAAYTIARPTINAVIAGYLRIRFHQNHFNKLMGILGTICAIYSLLQFPLFYWVESDPFTSNILISALLATTLINPLHLLCLKGN